MTTTTVTPSAPATRASAPGYAQALTAEWGKLWSLRSTYVMLLLAAVLSVGITALIALAMGATWDQAGEAGQASFDPTTMSMFGGIFSGIIFASMGVMAVANEYANGMIRATVTAIPRRGRVLAAKVTVVAAVTLVAGAVTTLAMFFVGQAVFGAYDLPTATLGDPDTERVLLAVTATSPVMPLIGVALGFILRSTAGAVSTLLGIMFVPAMFGAALPAWWQEHVIRYLPSSASDSLAQASPPDGSLTHLSTGPALAVLAAWLVVFLAAGYASLTRRDA